MPHSIISDRWSNFTCLFWQELFMSHGIQLASNTFYHTQTNGQTKAVNKCLENYLRSFVGDQPKGWAKWVPLIEWWYNNSQHSSTRMTPFKAFYGYEPPWPLPYVPGTTKVEECRRTFDQRTKNSSYYDTTYKRCMREWKYIQIWGERSKILRLGS